MATQSHPKDIHRRLRKKELFKTKILPATVRQEKTIGSFCPVFRTILFNLAQIFMFWSKMFGKDTDTSLSDAHLKFFSCIKKDLLQAVTTFFRPAKPGPQNGVLCDVSYYISGFVLLIDD